jgi:DNA repair protein RecN (Recombination protein N)
MLQSIHVKGLAVVESLNLELNQGLTVLTGETGAGKSILLTAMKLCLGERADNGLVRPGTDKADITLEFDINEIASAKKWLVNNDIDDDECIIRRTVGSDGRSSAFINGVKVNLKSLQSFSQYLVSIHGQHAHLDLLHSSKQCQLLDDSCSSKTTLEQCQIAFRHWRMLSDELSNITGGNTDNENEKRLLTYQIDELELADIANLAYDDLVSEHNRLSNMNRIIEIGETQAQTLYERDSMSIHAQLSSSQLALCELAELSNSFSDTAEQINDALIQLHEASKELRQTLDQQSTDPEQLDHLDKRLSTTHELARKLHVEPHELPNQLLRLKQQLEKLENNEERLSNITKEITQAESGYSNAAKALSTLRNKEGKTLQKKITNTLKTLGLPDGHFSIQVNFDADSLPQENGLDSVQFLVTTNPGMPAMPINKVASGGELSRISLAIQVVATQANITPTLVFDEVDVGIGGGVAETVGLKLKELAHNKQILCVTHLPQVASQGNTHLYVKKSKGSDQTKMLVQTLQSEQRIEEVARMLGGVDISDKTLAHAQEMLEKAI